MNLYKKNSFLTPFRMNAAIKLIITESVMNYTQRPFFLYFKNILPITYELFLNRNILFYF